jgi:hypothetical protein
MFLTSPTPKIFVVNSPQNVISPVPISPYIHPFLPTSCSPSIILQNHSPVIQLYSTSPSSSPSLSSLTNSGLSSSASTFSTSSSSSSPSSSLAPHLSSFSNSFNPVDADINNRQNNSDLYPLNSSNYFVGNNQNLSNTSTYLHSDAAINSQNTPQPLFTSNISSRQSSQQPSFSPPSPPSSSFMTGISSSSSSNTSDSLYSSAASNPSRTLFLRRINKRTPNSLILLLLERYGDVRAVYFDLKKKFFVNS